MAFCLEPGETLRQANRRIGLELFTTIELDLTPQAGPPDVHDARRCTKMLRALLQFIRGGLGPEICARETRRTRDFARSLGNVRDAEVRVETFRSLLGDLPPSQKRRLTQTEAQLAALAKAARAQSLAPASLRRALAVVRRAAKRWALLDICGADDDLFETSLERSYRRARQDFETAKLAPGMEAFHDWRKAVKTLGYHARLVQPIRPRKMKALDRNLDALGDHLGDDHDLAVLRDFLSAHHPAASKALRPRIARRRAALIEEATKLSEELFEEKPAHFAKRLLAWWCEWQRQ